MALKGDYPSSSPLEGFELALRKRKALPRFSLPLASGPFAASGSWRRAQKVSCIFPDASRRSVSGFDQKAVNENYEGKENEQDAKGSDSGS